MGPEGAEYHQLGIESWLISLAAATLAVGPVISGNISFMQCCAVISDHYRYGGCYVVV